MTPTSTEQEASAVRAIFQPSDPPDVNDWEILDAAIGYVSSVFHLAEEDARDRLAFLLSIPEVSP